MRDSPINCSAVEVEKSPLGSWVSCGVSEWWRKGISLHCNEFWTAFQFETLLNRERLWCILEFLTVSSSRAWFAHASCLLRVLWATREDITGYFIRGYGATKPHHHHHHLFLYPRFRKQLHQKGFILREL